MSADTDTFLHLSRPLGPAPVGAQPTTSPLNVAIQPQALFSILDHSLRRNKDQDRVIGTLLGTRSEDGTSVSIENCYAVPHTETQEQVEVDMDYQKTMLSLHLRANPREVLVGWYATSSELNTFSALIQNFYGQQGDGTFPHPAVHLTVSTDPGQPPESRTYISAPIGVTAERAADSCLFIPVPHEVKYGDAERSGLELISSAKERDDRTIGIVSDVESLERNIEYVLEMLERVRTYVSDVLDEEERPSPALGQFLLNTLSLAPRVEAADIERDFNNHIQDVLMISYLASTIRTQIDLSNRLATAALTTGGTEGQQNGATDGAGKGQQTGQRQRRNTQQTNGSFTAAEYRRIHPAGYVAALKVRQDDATETVITELPAILSYIASLSPERELSGRTPLEVAQVIEWIAWLSGTLHGQGYGAFLRNVRFASAELPGTNEETLAVIKETGRKKVLWCYDRVEARVGEGHAAHERLTIADLPLLPFWIWGRKHLSIEDMAARFPRYTAVIKELLIVPGVKEAVDQEGHTDWVRQLL
ncbi:MAG: hypothetical protein Q9159_002245 [Coniocarpon cinnabarinum]